MATWEIVCDDVLSWCEKYAGPKFHALLADPSYALSKKKKVDPDTPVEVEIKTVDDLVKAYHSFQQWGDTGFMSKSWDTAIGFNPETWRALAEHLLPGGFLFVFASSRGWHRLACALEDSGLIIQPSIFNWHTGEVAEVPFCLGWATGQSFPKSTRIDTQIDKAAGKLGKREVIGQRMTGGMGAGSPSAPLPPSIITGNSNRQFKSGMMEIDVTAPATDLARVWEGHRYGGQILKNALEPIIVAQKPWEGKRLDCIVGTGAGSLWVDGGRIGTTDDMSPRLGGRARHQKSMQAQGYRPYTEGIPAERNGNDDTSRPSSKGRWPANFALTHQAPHWLCSECGCSYPMQWEFQPCPNCGGELVWLEGCRRVGVKRVKTNIGWTEKDRGRKASTVFQNDDRDRMQEKNVMTYADPDGMETVDDFECVPECPVARLDEQAGERGQLVKPGYKRKAPRFSGRVWNNGKIGYMEDGKADYIDSGGPSRFYHSADWSREVAERIAGAGPVHYCPKAARKERDAGLEGLPLQELKTRGAMNPDTTGQSHNTTGQRPAIARNSHPTVKPISLCKWLATLLLPPKEYAPRRILIPFCGTMSEGIGALLAGWDEIVGIDSERDYCDIGEVRMRFWAAKMRETGSADPKAILKKKKGGISAQMPLEMHDE